uniref:Uncharacterized protein n=1 Tax=Candidozyma auris TaxID=498019 RepID=A0A0L0P918_CANAR
MGKRRLKVVQRDEAERGLYAGRRERQPIGMPICSHLKEEKEV